MRDAFGGVFTINMLLVFIFIYVAFSAVSLNYAKAFRVKNRVIDFVEENEILELEDYFGSGLVTKDKSKLDAILSNSQYNKSCNDLLIKEGEEYCYKGVKFKKINEEPVKGTSSTTIYYQITTYADWNLGALNKILALGGKGENSESPITGMWSIRGEAKVIMKR